MICQHIFVFLPCRMNVGTSFDFDAFPGSVANTMVWHALSTAQVPPRSKELIV